MATNTFSSVREPQFRPRPKASYTLRQVAIQHMRWFGGALGITGWIRDSGSTPQARRAWLVIWPHMTPIAYNDSDPLNGGNNYFFNGLKELSDSGETYLVHVHEVAQTKAAEIKDNLTPI